MSAKVVVFGNGRFAELAWYVLTHDSPLEVAGFTVDRDYLDGEELLGLPVVPFDAVAEAFPPADHRMLVALGYLQVNRLRAARYREGKEMGYTLASYVSTRAATWPDLDHGDNCMLFDHAVVHPFARLGADVIIRSGAHVSHHVQVGDHGFISAHAAIGGGAVIGDHCFIGLNATIRDNVTVAPGCVIAAGAVVVADTKPGGTYVGVPARRVEG